MPYITDTGIETTHPTSYAIIEIIDNILLLGHQIPFQPTCMLQKKL